ncbi:hypothetical protein ACFPOA_09610 [Lysobacter niabensis]|uniref:hypothetical protein n=1 Tax=Agrilutibacter niabensis TaxID=380628 RepID=UPI0036084935
MIGLTKKSMLTAALTLIAGSAIAGGTKPPPNILCHNIGGPRDLGANCEATGNCSVLLESGEVLEFADNQFLGIIIGANDNAWVPHLAHGDGFATRVFDPALHLASVIGPHQASNVECLARRETTEQPPEPGN